MNIEILKECLFIAFSFIHANSKSLSKADLGGYNLKLSGKAIIFSSKLDIGILNPSLIND